MAAAVIDWWNRPLTLVVIFFALCLLLLTWSIAGAACRACYSSGSFFIVTHTHLKKKLFGLANLCQPEKFFLKILSDLKQAYLITSQTKVERVIRIQHRTIQLSISEWRQVFDCQSIIAYYSETCPKRPSLAASKAVFVDIWSLFAGSVHHSNVKPGPK